MKKLIVLVVLSFLFTLPAKAANPTPSGGFGQLFWNDGQGHYAPLTVGQNLCLSTSPTSCVPPTPPPTPGLQLTDDNGNILTDDNGNILTAN